MNSRSKIPLVALMQIYTILLRYKNDFNIAIRISKSLISYIPEGIHCVHGGSLFIKVFECYLLERMLLSKFITFSQS